MREPLHSVKPWYMRSSIRKAKGAGEATQRHRTARAPGQSAAEIVQARFELSVDPLPLRLARRYVKLQVSATRKAHPSLSPADTEGIET
jgi:hypothetical protein